MIVGSGLTDNAQLVKVSLIMMKVSCIFKSYGWLPILLVGNLVQHTQAQMIIKQGVFSGNPAARTTVTGNVTNEGSSSYHGQLAVSGNFTNHRSFFSNEGRLLLNSEADQTIRTIDQTISSLTVAGSGRKKIIGNITIENGLRLEQGVIYTEGVLSLTETASIFGGSAASHVDGFLYHKGTGEKFYPVGKEGIYAPATLLNVTGDNPTVGVAYFPTSAIAGPDFHWQQRVADGTYDGSATQLTFTSDHTDYHDYSPELVVLSAEAQSDQYTVLGQSALQVAGNRFTITSDQPTAQPVLSVGFDIPEDSKHLYLPNAFSVSAPNDEDRRIKVYGQKVSPQNFYLAIQDTWGTVVYQTTSWEEASTQGWSGSAVTATVGTTYRYLLEGQYIGGKRFRKTGTIVQY